MLDCGKLSFGKMGLSRTLTIRIPNSDEKARPVKKTPRRRRGQRFWSGSKKTGVARYLLMQCQSRANSSNAPRVKRTIAPSNASTETCGAEQGLKASVILYNTPRETTSHFDYGELAESRMQ